MQQVTANTFVEVRTHGCNTGFVTTRDGVVMVDTPVAPAEAKKWREEINKFGPLRYVINGEPHRDHICGNCWFGGILIAHEGSRQVMRQTKIEELTDMIKRMAPGIPLDPDLKIRLPDITLTERMNLYLGDHTFQLINLPGHTPYQVAVYVPEERVVFTSDNVVEHLPFFHDAVPYAWLESLKQLQQLDVDRIIPGHGSVVDKSYLPKMNETVQYWINSVQSAISRGWSLEETVNNVTLAERYPSLGKDPMIDGARRRGIQHLYEVLKK
jgi:cyclase